MNPRPAWLPDFIAWPVRWPKNLPYPTSWLRAFIAGTSYAIVLAGIAPDVLREIRGQGLTNEEVTATIVSMFTVVWLLQWPLVAYYHHWFGFFLDWITPRTPTWFPEYERLQERLTERPQKSGWWHPKWISWREGLTALIVLAGASLTILLLVILLAAIFPKPLFRVFINWMWPGWFIVGAYFYQYDFIVREKRRKQVRKSKKTTQQAPTKSLPQRRPANNIETGSSEFKFEDGMATPKSFKDTKEWYVMRSGKAQGPYTKEELRTREKITARTNVRRANEENWTRAGEILELRPYLETSQ